jgi:hypothetical protein
MSNKWLKKYKEDSIVRKAYEFAKKAHKDDKRERVVIRILNILCA